MAIIGKVEKKDWRVRLLNLAIHAVLLLGAAYYVAVTVADPASAHDFRFVQERCGFL